MYILCFLVLSFHMPGHFAKYFAYTGHKALTKFKPQYGALQYSTVSKIEPFDSWQQPFLFF